MHYIVEASLNKGQPRLRIVDSVTGKTRLEWSLTRVSKMLETGEIRREDFLKPERYGMKLLLKNLFLLSCADELAIEHGQGKSNDNWCFNYKVGPK